MFSFFFCLLLNCYFIFSATEWRCLVSYCCWFLCCNLLWINDKGKRGWYVALCRWPVLARNKTKSFGLEISPWLEVEGDARRELVGQRSWQAVGEGRRREAVGEGRRREAVDTGHRSREASRHERGSRPVKEDRVKMSRHSSCFCGSFARNPC